MGKKSRKTTKAKAAHSSPSPSPLDSSTQNQLFSLISTLNLSLDSVPRDSLLSTLQLVLNLPDDTPIPLANLDPLTLLHALKVKYTMKGKQTWWWVFDDSLSTIGSILDSEGYVVVDDFYDTTNLLNDVSTKYKAGLLPTKGGENARGSAAVTFAHCITNCFDRLHVHPRPTACSSLRSSQA